MLSTRLHLNALFVLTLIPFILSGCARLPWQTQSVNSLVEQHQYQQALLQLDRQQRDAAHADQLSDDAYLEKVKTIKHLAEQHRQRLHQHIQHHLQQQAWAKADSVLHKAELNLPSNTRTDALRKRYHQLRNEALRKVDTRLALAEADYLLAKEVQLAFNKQDQTSDWRLTTDELELKHARLALAQTLMELSIAALASQDYSGAEVTFNTATQLNAELSKSDIQQVIHQGLAERTEQAILFRQNQLLKKLAIAESEQDFKKMQGLISILSTGPFKGQDVTGPIARAEQLILEHAKALDKQADRIYQRGDIQQAIELWHQAKSLAPELNGLQDKLTRAEKVQRKLEELRKG